MLPTQMRDDRGATMVEYSLLVMLVALGAIAGVVALGLDVAALFGVSLPG